MSHPSFILPPPAEPLRLWHGNVIVVIGFIHDMNSNGRYVSENPTPAYYVSEESEAEKQPFMVFGSHFRNGPQPYHAPNRAWRLAGVQDLLHLFDLASNKKTVTKPSVRLVVARDMRVLQGSTFSNRRAPIVGWVSEGDRTHVPGSTVEHFSMLLVHPDNVEEYVVVFLGLRFSRLDDGSFEGFTSEGIRLVKVPLSSLTLPTGEVVAGFYCAGDWVILEDL